MLYKMFKAIHGLKTYVLKKKSHINITHTLIFLTAFELHFFKNNCFYCFLLINFCSSATNLAKQIAIVIAFF